MLEVRGLNAFYGESQVLWDVSLAVPPGGVVCLMGRNGVGKTTLLKTIMGLLPVRSGRVCFDGDRPGRPEAGGAGLLRDRLRSSGARDLPEPDRAGEPAHGHARPRARREQRPRRPRSTHVFELFPKLKTLLGRKGGVLSGGEQQQLAIARVLLARPKLLLMDEPTEGIQPSVIDQIEEAIERIKGRGIAVLLVEQYLEFAWRLASAYAIMRKGTIVSRGATEDLRDDMVRQHLTV